MENNFLNSKFFQNTPQKDQTNQSLINPQQPGSNFMNPIQMGGLSNMGMSQPLGGTGGLPGTTQQSFGGIAQPNNMLGQRLSPFGTSTNSQFGAQNTPQNPFGGSTPAIGGSTLNSGSNFGSGNLSAFGTSQNTSTQPSSMFGSTSMGTFSNPQSNLNSFRNPSFGTPSNTFGLNSSPFSTSTPTAPSNQQWGMGSTPSIPGSWSMNSKGSKAYPYTTTRIKEDTGIFGDMVDITGMKEYANKAVDEIRKEDYEMSLCPPKAPTSGFGSSFSQPSIGLNSFANTPSSTPSGMFRSVSNPTTAFSGGFQNTGIGTPSALSGSGIGQSQQPPSFSTSQGNTGLVQPQGMFGSLPSSSQPLTSAQPLNSTQLVNTTQPLSNSIFGSSGAFTSRPFQASAGTSLFGSTPSTNFASPQVQPSGSSAPAQPTNLFGSSGTPSIFGNKTLGNDTTFVTQPQSTSNMFQPAPSQSSIFNIQAQPPSTLPAAANPQYNMAQPSNFSQPSFSPFAPQPKIDLSDPYLLKNINFEKSQQQKHSFKIQLPTPLFNNKKDTANVELKVRSPRPMAKNSIYTIPNLNDVDTSRPIPNLVVGFEGKGRIEYQEPVTCKSFDDIEKKLMFVNETVRCTDPIGVGLNRKARVYVEGFYPISRTTNEIIKGKAELFPQKGIQERFIYQLKNDSSRKFIDYDIDKGIYLYEVNHF